MTAVAGEGVAVKVWGTGMAAKGDCTAKRGARPWVWRCSGWRAVASEYGA